MPRGGKREGAGRPAGSGNVMTQSEKAIVKKVGEALPEVVDRMAERMIAIIEEQINDDSEIARLVIEMERSMMNAANASDRSADLADEMENPRMLEVSSANAKRYAEVIKMRQDIGERKFKRAMEIMSALAKFRQQFQLNVNTQINNNGVEVVRVNMLEK